ncbi:Ubiquinol--cytochrome c reductase, cytochrome B subunit [Leuconostoc mesenteroides subsp. cremoris T26]|nr:Ubiquinol--cytochrome c reductase, cytochrome B subunit [Leuconostoc mesenteroides subsp. cremoris T26]
MNYFKPFYSFFFIINLTCFHFFFKHPRFFVVCKFVFHYPITPFSLFFFFKQKTAYEIKAKRGADGHPLDGIPSHPYYTVHDIFGVVVFLTIFSAVIFFAPEAGGYFLEYNNFIPADSLKTPQHIAPVWYFTPFYSMLRATTDDMVNVFSLIVALGAIGAFIKGKFGMVTKVAIVVVAVIVIYLLKSLDAKFWGVLVMGGSVIILFFLPWLDHSPVKSIRFRPGWHKTVYGAFVFFFLILGYLGIQPPGVWGSMVIGSFSLDLAQTVSQIGTLVYFGFFLLMPWWSQLGEFKPVPDRVRFAAH